MSTKIIISILFIAVIAVDFWAGFMAGKEAEAERTQKWLKQNHLIDCTRTTDKEDA